MSGRPLFSRQLRSLAEVRPFEAAEALERRLGAPLRLRLGANESSFGASPRALEAAHAEVVRSQYYADPSVFELRELIAQQAGLSREQVMVGAGIDDVLGIVLRSYASAGAVGVAPLGTYPMFAFHLAAQDGRLEAVRYLGDRPALESMAERAQQCPAACVYLANPDNPSGHAFSAVELEEFRRALPPDCLLILDEAYFEFSEGRHAEFNVEDGRVVRLRTFSKVHGLAGLRIGYALASARAVREFDKVRIHFGTSRVGQAAAIASLLDAAHVAEVARDVREGREHYAKIAEAIGLKTLGSATNFVAFDCGDARQASSLLEALLRRGVFTRLPWAAPLDRCLRVSVGNREERELFSELLRESWSELASRP